MPSIAVDTPLGFITISEEHGHIVSLCSLNAPESDQTAVLRAARDQIAAYFVGRLKAFDLPVAPAGSAFQRDVWNAMLDIPYGQTRTYGALAAGLSSTARSVGQACGANPIPIIIPCHRVVGATGQMVGFSGFRGTATKEYLLGLEGAIAPTLPFEHARR
jgi:methylated-DNA-[protein]-cysteine S-methyltransferase